MRFFRTENLLDPKATLAAAFHRAAHAGLDIVNWRELVRWSARAAWEREQEARELRLKALFSEGCKPNKNDPYEMPVRPLYYLNMATNLFLTVIRDEPENIGVYPFLIECLYLQGRTSEATKMQRALDAKQGTVNTQVAPRAA